MYQNDGTIKKTLDKIQRHELVLPAIQREFVWGPDQICRLFDTLMQGYPFGTFLYWQVEPENSGKFKFYDFVREYHQRDAPHCPSLPMMQNQRLTAIRRIIKENESDGFPASAIYEMMAGYGGKSLVFEDEEVEKDERTGRRAPRCGDCLMRDRKRQTVSL